MHASIFYFISEYRVTISYQKTKVVLHDNIVLAGADIGYFRIIILYLMLCKPATRGPAHFVCGGF